VPGVFVMPGMLMMITVVMVIGGVLMLGYDLTNRSMGPPPPRESSGRRRQCLPPQTPPWTQWRTCSSSSPTATPRNADEAILTWVRTSMQ
jgi:hypothetical protein